MCLPTGGTYMCPLESEHLKVLYTCCAQSVRHSESSSCTAARAHWSFCKPRQTGSPGLKASARVDGHLNSRFGLACRLSCCLMWVALHPYQLIAHKIACSQQCCCCCLLLLVCISTPKACQSLAGYAYVIPAQALLTCMTQVKRPSVSKQGLHGLRV